MSDENDNLPLMMPDEIKTEYKGILKRLDAEILHAPDPAKARDWISKACAGLGIPEVGYENLSRDDREKVRNSILFDRVIEAYLERKQIRPAEDEQTAWHLAVRRGVTGYFNYDEARAAAAKLHAYDVWGPTGLVAGDLEGWFGAERAPIFNEPDWEQLVSSARRCEAEAVAATTDKAVSPTRAIPDDSEIRERGIDRQEAIIADPAEFARLTTMREKLETTRPSGVVYDRFSAKAGIADGKNWDELTPPEKAYFAALASHAIFAEQLALHEMGGVAKPEGMSDADFYSKRREMAASDAETYYTTSIRRGAREVVAGVNERNSSDSPTLTERWKANLRESGRGDEGTGESGDASPASGKGVPTWMAVYEKAIADAGKSGTFQIERDAVRARLANPQSDADRFLASAMNAKTKGGESLDFNTVTWKGRNQQSAAYGAFWLSHGLLKEAASTGIGTPPRQVAVEAIFASPELQYQAARAHVEKLLATKLANGKSLAELPPTERAAALATAYRFGVERASESYARGNGSRAPRGDHWTAAVATPVASEFARTPAPTERGAPSKSEVPVTVAASETLSVPVPTIKDADPYRDAVKRRAEAEGVALSDSQIADRARLEALYRSVLSKVAGVTDPKVIAEMEKRVPALRRITDGSVSMTAVEMLLAKDGQIVLDPSTRETLARQLGLEADPKTGKSPDLVDVLRGKAAEAVEAVKASDGKGPNQAAEVPAAAPPSAAVETKASPATVLAKVISDLKRDAAATGKNSAYNLEIAGALEKWFSQPAIGSRAAEIADKLGKLSGPALLDRAVNLATSAEPPAGATEFVRFTDLLEQLTESKAPKAAKGNDLTRDGVSVNTSPSRAARSEMSLGV
jgi:hypothetical protein